MNEELTTAKDGLTYKNASMYKHPISERIEFVDFIKIGADHGHTSGKKIKIVRTYENKVQKSKIVGQCMKKKNQWVFTMITGELATLLREKKLSNFLKDMNKSEKEVIEKLNKEWEIAVK